MSEDTRWSLPDLTSTLAWCAQRHEQGIRCTVATLSEFAANRTQSDAALNDNLACIRAIGSRSPGSSVSVKPTGLGIIFDEGEFARNLATLCREAEQSEVDLEIDMEGKNFVDATIRCTREVAERYPVTLALQAYLDRTIADADLCLRSGIRLRLVKGTYLGDTGDFATIRDRLISLIRHAAASGENFSIGTHDPAIISWIEIGSEIPREQVELGFLKGLGDETKIRLAGDGWDVLEYVPYGPGGEPYRLRRERYLRYLDQAGMRPVP